MSSKKKKTGKKKSPTERTSSDSFGLQFPDWSIGLLYALIAGIFAYYLFPLLKFGSFKSEGERMMLAMVSAGLGFFGTTGLFKRNVELIARLAVPLALLQVLVNVALTQGWISQNLIWSLAASTFTIPVAFLWFFILRAMAGSSVALAANEDFSIRQVYANHFTKMIALMVLIIGGVLIFYRLGYYDIWEDENLVINAAKGVAEQGIAYLNEGYDRAWIHTVLCAGIFEMFGISEFTGRLPSAIFGLIFIVLSFYVFARWYGLAWLALFIPLICLMNDRFLMLFRYMRMYALLIPLFLAGTYLIYRTLEAFKQPTESRVGLSEKRKWLLAVGSFLFLLLLAHVHKLAMIVLPVFSLYLLYQIWVQRTKAQLRMLGIVIIGLAIVAFLTFVVQLDKLLMFRQITDRILASNRPQPDYYEYLLYNGLPINSTLMFLIAGTGLLVSKVSQRLKSLLVLNYLFIVIALISMVYLIQAGGRDYRYVAHLVPFVVCTLLITVYYCGQSISKKSYPWAMVIVFLLSTLQFYQDYERIYVRHPWAPRYSEVYKTLVSMYKPGDALFVQNVKTFYLDPVALAGDQYFNLPKKKDYKMEQFRQDVKKAGHGWVMWELHKGYNWQKEILEYIYKNFKPIHNAYMDDLGVELFYFDETMIPGNQN